MDRERLLTIKQVSDRLQCSTRTVRRISSEGKLPKPLRVGRLIRWRESDITFFVTERIEL
ncbi:MAG: helix-turn-helix transcriptional regulator [Planctomycetota bacterium]|jgi:excisionase family DNA binding protein